jgi:Protein of unknown function (DUF1553)/Protein of unknown function (DUF1549)
MWARNLLFIGLVGLGVATLCANLLPHRISPRAAAKTATPRPADELDVVARIDQAFHDHWTGRKVKPTGRAPDLAIARRLSLALMGTVPSLQEIRQLEANPGDAGVRGYLTGVQQERRHADYLAERLARTYVGAEDGPFLVFRRRRFVSWLSDELMKNRPYDQLVSELIASEGLWTDKPPTNFLTVTFDPAKKNIDPERLSARVARAFLGVRIDCAQCHPHPFQPWKQEDFHGLAAFFGQTHQGFTGIYDGDGEHEMEVRKTGKKVVTPPHVPFLPELLPNEGSRRQRLAVWVTHPRNPYLARATVNRVWALMFSRALVDPVDDMGNPEQRPPALERVLDLLADDFVQHGFDLRRLIRVIAATEAFQLDSAAETEVTEAQETAWAAFPLTRLRPEQVVGSLLQAASLETINNQSHLLVRLIRAAGEKEFVDRYGDPGEDEFDGRAGTIPQRLLLMNGRITHERTKEDMFNAATRIAWLAPTDKLAVETAYLAVLTRRPTPDESAHFVKRLDGTREQQRQQRLTDLYWTLVNSTEFSWNH